MDIHKFVVTMKKRINDMVKENMSKLKLGILCSMLTILQSSTLVYTAEQSHEQEHTGSYLESLSSYLWSTLQQEKDTSEVVAFKQLIKDAETNSFALETLLTKARNGLVPEALQSLIPIKKLLNFADDEFTLGNYNEVELGALVMLLSPTDITENFVRYLRSRAEENEAFAQNLMGYLYAHGNKGVLKDRGQAVAFYSFAAEKNYVLALHNLHNLGKIYMEEKNYEKALALFRLCKKHNFIASLYDLGRMHKKGWGVIRSSFTANEYFYLAASQVCSYKKDDPWYFDTVKAQQLALQSLDEDTEQTYALRCRGKFLLAGDNGAKEYFKARLVNSGNMFIPSLESFSTEADRLEDFAHQLQQMRKYYVNFEGQQEECVLETGENEIHFLGNKTLDSFTGELAELISSYHQFVMDMKNKPGTLITCLDLMSCAKSTKGLEYIKYLCLHFKNQFYWLTYAEDSEVFRIPSQLDYNEFEIGSTKYPEKLHDKLKGLQKIYISCEHMLSDLETDSMKGIQSILRERLKGVKVAERYLLEKMSDSDHGCGHRSLTSPLKGILSCYIENFSKIDTLEKQREYLNWIQNDIKMKKIKIDEHKELISQFFPLIEETVNYRNALFLKAIQE